MAAVLGDLVQIVEGLPEADDLIGPIRIGLTTLTTVFSGDLRGDINAALDQIGAEFDIEDGGSALARLRRLAEAVSGSSELGDVQGAIAELVQLAAGQGTKASGLPDLVTSVLSMLDAIGAMMTLETMLAEAERLGLLVAAQIPSGIVGTLSGAVDAGIAAAEEELTGLDVNSDAAVDRAIEAIIAAHASAQTLIATLNHSMAFGEATLTYADPDAVVARAEAVLVRLRGVAVDEIADVMSNLMGILGPVAQLDLGAAPQFTLDDLLTQAEGQTAALAAEVATLDLSELTGPLTEGLGSVAGLADDARAELEAAQVTLRDALGQVRDAVAALAVDQVVDALQAVTDVIAEVLAQLGDLLDGIQDTIGSAAGVASDAMIDAENAVLAFQIALDKLFGDAKDFVDGLGLESAVGDVADGIQEVADLIAQADMTPYFVTAQGAMNTAAGVIAKVPFSLLPDEMEQEVITLVRPIKTADATAFRAEIIDILQINADGSFALRDDLETAVSEVQAQFDALVLAMADLDPQKLADAINPAFEEARIVIEGVAPAVELRSLTEALDRAKALVAGLDLDAVLQPLSDGFDAVLAQVDGFTPSTLIAPLDAEVDALRQKVLDVTQIETLGARLDEAKSEALRWADILDPDQLEEPLTEAMTDVQTRLAKGDLPDPLGPLGAVLSSLLAGSGEVVMPTAITQVSAWVRGQAVGADRLTALTGRMHDAIAAARTEVEAADPNALASQIAADSARLVALVEALPAGAAQDRLLVAARSLDVSADLRLMGPNHARFVLFLTQSQAQAANLAARGFSEVDTVGATLRASLAPLMPLVDAPKAALARMGFTHFQRGLPGLLDDLFAVATPARIVGLVMPVFIALHGRVATLLDALIDPMKTMLDDVIGIVTLFDLSVLGDALDTIHAEVRADIAAFHPGILLGDMKTAFANAQASVAGFDPLGPVVATLETLKATVIRVLAVLDADALLAVPIEIFADLTALLGSLDINDLLEPLYDRLDAIADQVADGLDGTVAAFEGLQDALPSQIGSTSISDGASVGGT